MKTFAFSGLLVLSILAGFVEWDARAEVTPAAPANPVLKAYIAKHGDYPLTEPRISTEGRLVLEENENMATRGLNPVIKRATETEWVKWACSDWLSAIREGNAAADPSVMLLTIHTGSLWECGDSRPKMIEEWDDFSTPSTTVNQIGNTYISVAGQMAFATVNTYGINFAEGVTLYKRRLDLAFTMSLVNTNTTLSMGLLFRYHFPIVPAFGMNLGVQPLFIMSLISPPAGSTEADTITTTFSSAFLGGFNFNVPSGTIDLTGSIATNGAYTTLIGHTFFFNVR